MVDDFSIDPDALQRVTEVLRGAAGRFRGHHTSFSETLAYHHGCWGTDDIGTSFAGSYVDPASTFADNARLAVDGLDSLPDDVDQLSHAFQDVDHKNAVRIDKSYGSD